MFTIENHTAIRYGRFRTMEHAEKFLDRRGYFLSAGLTMFVKALKKRKGQRNLFRVAKVVRLEPGMKPVERGRFR